MGAGLRNGQRWSRVRLVSTPDEVLAGLRAEAEAGATNKLVAPYPVPMNWSVQKIAGQPLVAIVVNTPVGTQVYFLENAKAIALSDLIRGEAGGVTVVSEPSRLIVPR